MVVWLLVFCCKCYIGGGSDGGSVGGVLLVVCLLSCLLIVCRKYVIRM